MKVGGNEELHGFGKWSFKVVEMSSIEPDREGTDANSARETSTALYNDPRTATLNMTLAFTCGVSYATVGSAKPLTRAW